MQQALHFPLTPWWRGTASNVPMQIRDWGCFSPPLLHLLKVCLGGRKLQAEAILDRVCMYAPSQPLSSAGDSVSLLWVFWEAIPFSWDIKPLPCFKLWWEEAVYWIWWSQLLPFRRSSGTDRLSHIYSRCKVKQNWRKNGFYLASIMLKAGGNNPVGIGYVKNRHENIKMKSFVNSILYSCIHPLFLYLYPVYLDWIID